MNESQDYDFYEESDSDSYLDIKDINISIDFCDTNSGIFWGKQTEDEKTFVQHFKSSYHLNQTIEPNDDTNEEHLLCSGSEELNVSQSISKDGIQEVVGSTEALEPISEPINESIDETTDQSLPDMRSDPNSSNDNNCANTEDIELSEIEDNEMINLAINCSFNYSKPKTFDANNNPNEDIPLEFYEEIGAKDSDSELSFEESNKIRNKTINSELKMSFDDLIKDIKTSDPVIDSSIKSSVDSKSNKYIIQSNEDMTETDVSDVIESEINNQMVGSPSSHSSLIENKSCNTEELPTVEPELQIETEVILMDSGDDSSDTSGDEETTEPLREYKTRANSLNEMQLNTINQTFNHSNNESIEESIVAQPISAAQNGEQLVSLESSIREVDLWSNSQEFSELVKQYITNPGFNLGLPQSQESDEFPGIN